MTMEIIEADLAFDQNGAPIVAAERTDGHVWIYFFDPSENASVFRDFGPGRTPRIMLDDPARPQDSEVLCFYIAGGELKYRGQSDRFQAERDTGLAMTADQALERVVRTTDRRIHVVYSTRDPAEGQYSLSWHSSEIYPWELDEEGMDLRARAREAALLAVLLEGFTTAGELDVAGSAQAGALEVV